MSNCASRPISPSTVLTSAAVTASLVNASTWSSAESASRMLPSAARATSDSAASSTFTFSRPVTCFNWSRIDANGRILSSKT